MPHDENRLREWTDVIGKVLIGLAGVGVTVVIGISQLDIGERGREFENRKLLVEEYRFHFQRAAEKPNKVDYLIAQNAAERLKAQHDLGYYLHSLNELAVGNQQLAALIRGDAKLTLKTDEALAKDVPPDASKWFAVVGSFQVATGQPKPEELAKDAAKKLGASGQRQPVEIYRTKISQHNAVALGGPMNEVQAREAASLARRLGIAGDAFAQANREWTKVADCDQSGCRWSAEGQK